MKHMVMGSFVFTTWHFVRFKRVESPLAMSGTHRKKEAFWEMTTNDFGEALQVIEERLNAFFRLLKEDNSTGLIEGKIYLKRPPHGRNKSVFKSSSGIVNISGHGYRIGPVCSCVQPSLITNVSRVGSSTINKFSDCLWNCDRNQYSRNMPVTCKD